MDRGRFLWLVLVAGAIGAIIVVAAALVFSSGPPQVVGFGEPIRQDDFVYTVVGVAKVSALGRVPNGVRPRGRFYVVTVQVDNEALRVPFQWDPSIAHVIDASGRTYEFSVEGQRAIDNASPGSTIVEHGTSAKFQIVFDLPKSVDRPALAFSNGIMMGDLFSGGAYLKARVPLN